MNLNVLAKLSNTNISLCPTTFVGIAGKNRVLALLYVLVPNVLVSMFVSHRTIIFLLQILFSLICSPESLQ